MGREGDDVEVFFDEWEHFFRTVRKRRSHWVHDIDKAGTLSYAQFSLVLPLADGEEHTVRDLAEAAEVSAPTATRMLDGLATAGYVSRRPHVTDRRRVIVELTSVGRDALRDQRAIVDAKRRRLWEALSPEERVEAQRVLGRLAMVMGQL